MQDPIQSEAVITGSLDIAGRRIGRFEIRRLLGSGGMGQVYLAEDTTLKRVVAIKRMAPRLQVNEEERLRFIKEAQRASALNHPSIACVYDVLEDHNEVLLVMEYVEGTTLRGLLRHPLPLDQFLTIATQCAEGLAAAHAADIVHGDIKPENLMCTPAQRLKILDFGVARRSTLAAGDTPTRTIETVAVGLSGTPAYMAPEVLTEEPHDGRADIFSLGLVFYEMLGGTHPFLADNFIATVDRVLNKQAVSVRLTNPAVPPALEAVINHMLAKHPADRYASAEQVAADLRAIQRGQPPAFAAAATSPARPPWFRRKAVWGAGAAVVLLAAAVPIGYRLEHRRPSDAGAPHAPVTEVAKTTTLVVLPLETTDPDPKLAAFDNGLVNVLTAKLVQLSSDHPLQVVSSSELQARRIRTLHEAQQEFGATLGLRLALQHAAEVVRLTYTLLDAKTGHALQSNTFDAPSNDPFALEDQAASGAAAFLGIQLRAEEQRALLAHGTTFPEAYTAYVAGRGYLENASQPENIDSAILLFSRALKLDSQYGLAQADLGTAYWIKYDASKDKRLIAKANQACAHAVELGNAGVSGHVCLGTLANGTGAYEKAVDQFTKAVQLDPGEQMAYTGLATSYERLGKRDEAEATYQKVVELRPKYWLGYNLLGAFYLRQAEYDKSAAMFQKVIEVAPESFRGYANLGAIYLAEGKYQEAIQPLNVALRLRPTEATYSNLGTAYFHLRRFSEAATTYAAAVKLESNDHETWGNLGNAYYFVGEKTKAQEAFRKAVQLGEEDLKVNPREPFLLKSLADYNIMLGNRSESVKYLDEALTFGKSDKEILFSAALIYNRLGETGTALEWLQKALNAGYSPVTIRESPDLDNLHSNPRFQMLVKGKRS
jgi:tetratricopeptide (TPR) repeat protein